MPLFRPHKNPFVGCLLLLACLLVPGALGLARAQPAGPRVSIDSSPPGAAIYIDGRERGGQGYTSSTFKIRLSRGPHRVLLELEGYKSLERLINVNQAERFAFPLERAPAKLEVKSPGTNETARDGVVFIDGALAGRVPVPVEVPSGRHKVEVRKSGYQVHSEDVELRAGEARTLWVTLTLEVKSGSLLIGADTEKADVFVDGTSRGSAPVLVDNLPEGEHLVEVRRVDGSAAPWRRSERVLAGQQTKLMAHLEVAVTTGSLLIVSDGDADLLVDGTPRGKVNQEIQNLSPGQHAVEVRPKTGPAMRKIVDIEAGRQHMERIDLPKVDPHGSATLRIIMVNPVEGAEYFINGKKLPNDSEILSDRGIKVAPGTNIIVVRSAALQTRKTVILAPGATETVTIDLRDVGRIQIASDPRGGQILLDHMPVGQTPYIAEDVKPGGHLVEILMPGKLPFLQQVMVRGGEQALVSAQLMAPPSGPVGDDPNKRRGLSSFSALTVDPGQFTMDTGTGFPYFVDLRLTVGAFKIKSGFGLDAGIEMRTTFYETDIIANLRLSLAQAGPIAFGANVLIGGGGGPRKRNGIIFEAGIPITLLAGNLVRVTGRPYLQVYSDRLCPSINDLQDLTNKKDYPAIAALSLPEHVGDRCTGGGYPTDLEHSARYANAIADQAGWDPIAMKPTLSGPTYGANKMDLNGTLIYQEDGNPVLDRFTGVRLMLQLVVEIAVTRDTNLWLLIEGAPFQKERQAYTDKFNRIFPLNDLPLYGRAGFTIKF